MQDDDIYPLLDRSGRSEVHSMRSKTHDSSPKPKKGSYWTDAGWKVSLTTSAITASLVLLINLSVTIWSTTREKAVGHSSLRVLKEGSCDETRTVNTGIHLAINILSTLLLGASNYCMQCLSAPTRDDVQKAHSNSKWLDIGVPSVHNLHSIPWLRVFLWWLLILSSAPLHLLYNSVVFSSLSTVPYDIFTIQDNSADGKSVFDASFEQINKTEHELDVSASSREVVLEELWQGIKNGTAKNLTALECIDAYDTAFQTSHSTVMLVTDLGSNSSYYGVPEWAYYAYTISDLSWNSGCAPNVYDWICEESSCEKSCKSQLSSVKKNADNWKPNLYYTSERVKYCMSQPVAQHCRLFFSTSVMSYIIVANATKVAIILFTVLRPPRGLLLVIGDAIQSFMASPDSYSVDSCLATGRDVKNIKKSSGSSPLQWHRIAALVPGRWSRANTPSTTSASHFIKSWTGSRPWEPLKRRWGAAVSRRRWITSLLFYLLAFGTTLGLMIWGILSVAGPNDFVSLWSLGVGKTTESTLISGFPNFIESSPARITLIIVIANLPQFFFSFLYFQYNGLFTGMLAAKEWSDFGIKRRGIRVSSDPEGTQRSRYFLQLPYRWGIPLMVISILIHWLLSQSLFVVAMESASYSDSLWMTCGYSPAAIFLVLIVSIFMVSGVVVTGYLRLPSAIPLVGSCSLAIAASCHHPDGLPQPEAPLEPLKWGVMRKPEGWHESNNPGHCGFSSQDVEEPEPGVEYA